MGRPGPLSSGLPHAGLTLRPATVADSDRLLEWRNDLDVVAFSITARGVESAEHERWLATRLVDSSTRLWIAEEGGTPVGQVRVDLKDGVGTVSIGVDPQQRGHGVGTAILQAMVTKVAADQGVRELRAIVHPENGASLRAFAKTGFRSKPHRQDGFVVLELAMRT